MLDRIRTRLSVVGLMVVGAMLMALPAFATAPDVGTEITGAFGDIQSLIITVIAGAFFALMVVVVGIRVGARWFKRGANG